MLLTVVISTGVIGFAAAAMLLWWGLGAYSSMGTRIGLAILAVILGNAIYFGLQIGWEMLHPEARAPNGDILAYYAKQFSIILGLFAFSMFFVRRDRPQM
jgi:hypothetical protein